MKTILTLFLLSACAAFGQAVTNINVSINLNARELAALDVCLAAENQIRTNAQPPLAVLDQRQFLRQQFNQTIDGLVAKTDRVTRTDLLTAYTNASPAKRQAALDALK